MTIFRLRYSHAHNVRLIKDHPLPSHYIYIHLWEWPEHPWSSIHIDYASPIRYRYLLVVIDSYSKWLNVASANPTNTIQSLRNIFETHGLPQVLVSDNGAPFVSAEFK